MEQIKRNLESTPTVKVRVQIENKFKTMTTIQRDYIKMRIYNAYRDALVEHAEIIENSPRREEEHLKKLAIFEEAIQDSLGRTDTAEQILQGLAVNYDSMQKEKDKWLEVQSHKYTLLGQLGKTIEKWKYLLDVIEKSENDDNRRASE